MTSTKIINSFVGGELSPKLGGRTDIQQYYQSAGDLLNMIVEPYGGAKRAQGTYYCAETKSSAKESRLMPFSFSNIQSYIIEVGDLYMRFYKDFGQILSGGSAYEIVSPYAEDEIWDIVMVPKDDIAYLFHPSHPIYKLSRTGHTAWTLAAVDFTTGTNRPPMLPDNVTSTTITPSADTGTGITLTASAALFNTASPSLHVNSVWRIKSGYVKITAVTDSTHATANVLYGVSLGTGPAATDDWAEGAWSDYRGYPACGSFYEQRLMAASSTNNPQTIWGSAMLEYENFEEGTEDDDGLSYTIASRGQQPSEVILWLYPAQELFVGTEGGVHRLGSGSTTSPLTPSNVYVTKETSYKSAAIPPVQVGSYVYYVQKYGHSLRELAYDINTDTYPAGDASILSDHLLESGIIDMAYQQSPDNLVWCVLVDGTLALFTRQIEQKVSAWTPGNTDGYYESVAVIPGGTVDYDQVWFIVRRTINGSTKRYVEFLMPPTYADQEDLFYVHSGLSIDSPKTISAATKADPVVITASSHGFSNGDIVRIRGVEGMTELNQRRFKVSNKNTNTFELHDLEGNDVDGTTYAAYTSGGEVRKCFNTFSGLSHLEGKTVKVLADGAAHPDCVVSSGAITLDDYYSQVNVGLHYQGRVETNDLESGSSYGTSQGKTKRVGKVTIRFYKSLGCKVGVSGKQDTVIFRTNAMNVDQAPELITDDKEVSFPSGWDKKKKVLITQDDPLPMHILAIIPWAEVNE